MRKWLFICALLACPANAREPLDWCVETAERHCVQDSCARAAKPTFVYLEADWCGPCHELELIMASDPEVMAGLRKFSLVRVNVDRVPAVAKKFPGKSLPAGYVLDKRCHITEYATSLETVEALLIRHGKKK